MACISGLMSKVGKFKDNRDWGKYHNPKNLALSISIEAAELLEIFQWDATDKVDLEETENVDKIKDELADILIYMLSMADALAIDLEEAVNQKLIKNAGKYPA